MSSHPSRLERLHLAVVLGTIALGSLVILPDFIDTVMLPKATVLAVGAVLVLALAGLRLLHQGRLRVPASRPLGVAAALLLVMTIVTVLADNPATSAIGRYSRYGGLAQYAAYAVLFTAVAVLYRRRPLTSLTRTLLVSLALLLAYGAVQVAGVDPITWRVVLDEPLFSTMGNTNFASAFTGILVPLALSVALSKDTRRRWRVAAGILVLAGLAYIAVLQALQGPVIVVVGCAFVVAVAVGDPRPRLRRASRPQLAALVALLLAGVAAGLRVASFAIADLPNSLHQRTQLWTAAWRIFLDHPVTGIGLDGYGYEFLAYRPAEHATERGVAFIDSAHQVPLSMFAHGGLPLGVAYLAFVLTIAVVLVRGLRAADGPARLVLAGYGGGWLAYQVQSLVSLDVPGVSVLHFVTAGAIVAVAAAPRVVTVGGRLSAALPRLVAAGVVGLLTLTALSQVVRPLRADANAALALVAARSDNPDGVLPAQRRAIELNPFEPSYHRALGRRLRGVDREAAIASAERAARLEAGSVSYAQDVVALGEQAGDAELVEEWESEILRRDPYNVRLLNERAAREMAAGRAENALPLLHRFVEVNPRSASAHRRLAEAQLALGDDHGARRTYKALLEIEPEDPVALEWLQFGPAP